MYLRDSGSLESLVLKQCLSVGDYLNTRENRLIQGIFGYPTEIPLVKIDFENDEVQGKFLCGLVDSPPQGVDILVGNDLEQIVPLSTSLVSHAITDMASNKACPYVRKMKTKGAPGLMSMTPTAVTVRRISSVSCLPQSTPFLPLPFLIYPTDTM